MLYNKTHEEKDIWIKGLLEYNLQMHLKVEELQRKLNKVKEIL